MREDKGYYIFIYIIITHLIYQYIPDIIPDPKTRFLKTIPRPREANHKIWSQSVQPIRVPSEESDFN